MLQALPEKMPRAPTKRTPKPNARHQRLKPYLACFFDVPYRTVQEILGVTHHAIDPLRREMGYDRWPYPDVKSDNFCMTADEIVETRRRMMQCADEGMRDVLSSMKLEAEKARARWKRRKVPRQTTNELLDLEIPYEFLAPIPNGDESRAFWQEIGQLLLGE